MKKLLLILTSAMLLFSCGEKEFAGITVKPETTEVSGGLGDCYKVVEKEYKSTKNVLTVELERTDAELPFELKEGEKAHAYGSYEASVNVRVGFGIEFLDKDGKVLETKFADAVGASYSALDPEKLAKLKAGEKGIIRFTVADYVKEAVMFRISSAYEEVGHSGSSSASSDNTESTSSTDWDKVLDEYESMMNSYVNAVKKSSQGDMSAMTEMANYLEKAQSFADKLENAEDDMSSTQWARFMKIQEKMVKAASGL